VLGWNNGRFWEGRNSEGNPVTENFTLVSLALASAIASPHCSSRPRIVVHSARTEEDDVGCRHGGVEL